MTLQRRRLLAQAAFAPTTALLGAAATAQTAQNAIGSLERLEGRVSRVSALGTQELQLGQSVFEGDKVITAANTEAVFKLLDGAVIAVRPSSELSLAQYRFSQQRPQDNSVLLQLARGGLRKLTGLIGKASPQSVRITTAIGIRGTEFEVTHVEPPAANPSPTPSSTPAPPASADNNNPANPPTPSASPAAPTPSVATTAATELQPGSYLRVYSGATTLRSTEDNREINVPAGQTAFAPNLAAAVAVTGAVAQSFGLLRNSPARAFFNGKFDGSMQSIANIMVNELQNRLNQQMNRNMPSELRRMMPNLNQLFKQ
jgi:hypothetical protein